MKKNINTPTELFFDQLRDLYTVEIQLRDAMPRLIVLCTNEELREMIVSHSHQNGFQISEISAVFKRHGQSREAVQCKAMEGLIKDGTAKLEAVNSPAIRDLMIISHCLRVEYYEIAAYEFTCTLAGRLGLIQAPEVLNGLMEQELDMAAALMLLEPELFETAHLEDDSNLMLQAVS